MSINVCFQGVTVARLRMSKMTEHSYSAAIKTTDDRCIRDNKNDLRSILKRIIVDCSSAQIAGSRYAFGEERGEGLIRACRAS